MGASTAALIALHELGFNWRAVSGSEYWTYEGVKLSALAAHDPPVEERGDLSEVES